VLFFGKVIEEKGITYLSNYKNDLQFADAYVDGDQQSEKKLYADLNKLILHLIGKMESTGVVFFDRENITSEILFHVMIKENKKVIRNYQGKSKLFTYLWPIVRNKLIDLIRAESRYHSITEYQENLDEVKPETTASTGTVEAIFEDHVAKEGELEKFIKYAKWMQGLNYDDIIFVARKEFPKSKTLNSQRIAYVLHSNRKQLQKKLKKLRN
jgi:DNA-directed RNA polymerase specialized sigma24 family protein